MEVNYGNGPTKYGPGVIIELTGDEVALAILAYLTARKVHIKGPLSVSVNGELCEYGQVYVDPSGEVVFVGELFSGRGKNENSIEPVDLRTCKPGDILVSSQGYKLKYVSHTPWKWYTYLDHVVEYLDENGGSTGNYGTRTHDGYVFKNNRNPYTDHDIVKIIRK